MVELGRTIPSYTVVNSSAKKPTSEPPFAYVQKSHTTTAEIVTYHKPYYKQATMFPQLDHWPPLWAMHKLNSSILDECGLVDVTCLRIFGSMKCRFRHDVSNHCFETSGTYIHKLTPFSHGGKKKLQNVTCYDPLASSTFVNLIKHARRLQVLCTWLFWRTSTMRSMYVLVGRPLPVFPLTSAL